MGRKTKYDPQLEKKVLQDIANGKSLRAAAKKQNIAPSTFLLWVVEDKPEGIAERYVRAREAQAEYLADEIVDISDEANAKNANAVKVRVDARKWTAAKMRPQRYGDFSRHEDTGKDGGPIEMVIKTNCEPS